MEAKFVVVGGGIAGISCIEILAFLQPNEKIILISESALVKTAINIHAITQTLSTFDVEEKSYESLTQTYPNLTVIHSTFTELTSSHSLKISNEQEIVFNYLCICTGAKPNVISQSATERILGIRDTDSVEKFVNKLQYCKVVGVVGNGGIASELVYKIKDAQVHWIVKDNHISATFVDPGAAEFFQSSLTNPTPNDTPLVLKRMRYNEESHLRSGAALGPDWYKYFDIKGRNAVKNVKIHYGVEISSVEEKQQLKLTLSNDETLECDVLVSATGVTANINFKTYQSFAQSNDGGILVNKFMQTSIPNIYAAGDVCTSNWDVAKHWFQMKLWTQARQMGSYAAKCMVDASNSEESIQDFCFELFAHSTKLFGYKVILLGLYNGQKLGNNYEILLRTTKNMEYIKFVLVDNKLQGALLIGDTDLEEMCENLILNQIDLSPYGDDILNPNIDIEDYFD